ncbi:MAG: hypothetical protein F4Z05_03500, partial [Chloroflexi bacterium]|nr:hypothetical protein [Chloroflexota bacterium]
RVLKTFGEVEDMTSAEAQGHADQYTAERWDPVVAELQKLEAAESTPEPTPEPTSEPGELQVAVTASPAHPLVNETVTLRAAISNAPSGSDPSYKWEIRANGDWHSQGSRATLSFLASQPESWSFRVTVSYDTGDSVTSDPITVSWTETRPNRAPVVNTKGGNYADFVGKGNAPRGVQVSKPYEGIFSDPDGDELTYTVSVPADRNGLLEWLVVAEAVDRVGILVDADDDWKAASPALADPLTITVTLTATDPDGLPASINGDFFTNWDSSPALVNAMANAQAIKLTFDQAVQADPAPAPGQFTVNVANEDGTSAGTIAVSGVSVNGAVVTLELASALEKGQTVTLDYAHDADAPLTRAAGGGDSASSFTGQAVSVSITDLPGSPRNFAVSTTPGQLDVAATWDALDGATSYELRWRLNDGEYEADDTATATETEATITVSGDGRWVVGLKGCNAGGCGPEVEATAQVGPFTFSLSQARDEAGNPRPRTFDANWTPVPDATGYRLRWSRLTDGNSPPPPSDPEPDPAPARGGPSKTKSDIPGPSGDGRPGTNPNPQQDNQMNLPGDQTSAQFTVSGDGDYLVELEMYLHNRDTPDASYRGHVAARATNPGNVVLFHQFDCATQSSKITGVYGQALDGGVHITWNTPAGSIDQYQYQVQRGNAFVHGRDDWTAIDPGAPVDEGILVSNMGYSVSSNTGNTQHDHTQAFTTGNHILGYVVTGIDLNLLVQAPGGNDPTTSVEIWSSYNDQPQNQLGTFTTSSPLVTGVNTFTASGAGVHLDPKTTYVVLVDFTPDGNTGVHLRNTEQDDEDQAASGWSISDESFYRQDGGSNNWNSFVQSRLITVHGYARQGLQANALAGTTSFTLTNLQNYSSYAILLRGVAGSSTRCFQKMVFVTPYDTTIPAITGFDAYKGYGTGPRQITLEWDDPGDSSLTYDYFYTGVPVHWSGWRGRGGWFPVEGSTPTPTRDGKLTAVISGLPCQNSYYHIRMRPNRGSDPGTTAEKAYVHMASHGSNDDSVRRGDGDGNCISGWGGDDVLYGEGGFDILYGNDDDDILHGGPGNDWLFGGKGVDQLYGNRGNDFLNGGPGADHLDGGPGTDWADYSGSDAGVTVALGTGVHYRGNSLEDTLVSIENVIGSDYRDILNGDAEDNVFRGGASADEIRGWEGSDWVDYSGSPQGVTVDLSINTQSGAHAEGDYVTGVENISGSDHADTLTGDAGDNILRGGAGADTMDGGGGTDTADYSASPEGVDADLQKSPSSGGVNHGGHAAGDTFENIENLRGSDHDDAYLGGTDDANVIWGGGGNDELNGQDGTDTLHGGPGNDTLYGDDDADKLYGGPGNDALYGGGSASVDSDIDEFYFYPDFGRDTIGNYTLGSTRSASDKIYLCGMEGVSYTGSQGSDGYYISVYSLQPWWPGSDLYQTFQGSITLEGVNPGGFSNNEPFGNLNILVPSRTGFTCDEVDLLEADANSPMNLAIESHYGAGIARASWDAPSGGVTNSFEIEWKEAETGIVRTYNEGAGVRSFTLRGKRLARWVRVGAKSNSGIRWSAAVAPPADPLQVWFIEGTPRINASIGRVFFYTDTNVTYSVTPVCSVPGATINCIERTLTSLDHPNHTGGTNLPVPPGTSVRTTISVARTSNGETASHVAETQSGGPLPPQAWASGGNGRLVVVWSEAEEDETSQVGSINGYVVELRTRLDDGSWSGWLSNTVKAVTDRTHTFTGLAEGTYQVRVRGRTDGASGEPSPSDIEILGGTSPMRTVVVSRANVNPPQPPRHTTSITPGEGKLTVNWERPYADDRSLIYGYAVRYKVASAPDSDYETKMVYPRPGAASGSVELTSLTNGTTYTVQMRSHNAVGVSQWHTIGFKNHTPN